MKTKHWIFLFSLLAILCAVLSVFIFHMPAHTRYAKVFSEGQLRMTLDLSEDGVYQIKTGDGWNLIRVAKGRLSVSAASCPTQDCVRRKPTNGGAPIVCLPNRLVIEFTDRADYDAFIG